MTMSASAPKKPSIFDTRRHQMFPVLEPSEIERVRRFAVVRSYGVGEALARSATWATA
jgi:thioredoxin reductase (NADPH)